MDSGQAVQMATRELVAQRKMKVRHLLIDGVGSGAAFNHMRSVGAAA
jgi:hypothetical protein